MKRLFLFSGLLLFAAVLSACSKSTAPPEEVAAKPAEQPTAEDHKISYTEKLEPYECGTVQRIHTLDGIFLASQPAPDDFKMAKEGGIKTVVNLRPASEQDFDEAAVLAELGMEYHNVPFGSPTELTDEVFDEVRAMLSKAEAENQPLLLHCSSANRVGAIWLAHRVLDGKLSVEEAEIEAKVVGMKTPAYGDKAKDYVKRTQEQGALSDELFER